MEKRAAPAPPKALATATLPTYMERSPLRSPGALVAREGSPSQLTPTSATASSSGQSCVTPVMMSQPRLPSPLEPPPASPSTLDVDRTPRRSPSTSISQASDSDSACSANSSPTTPVSASSPPIPPRAARRPPPPSSRHAYSPPEPSSLPSAPRSIPKAHPVAVSSLIPKSLQESGAESAMANLWHRSSTSPGSSSSSVSSSPVSHPFLVDQTPYLARRLSGTSLHSEHSASSAGTTSPWRATAGSPATRSVDRLDTHRGRSDQHISSLGSAADHLLADHSWKGSRGRRDPNSSVSTVASYTPSAAMSTVSLGSTTSRPAVAYDCWPRQAPISHPQIPAILTQAPESNTTQVLGTAAPISLTRQRSPPSTGPTRSQSQRTSPLRDSAASSLSAKSVSSSASSFLATPTPSSPEASPTTIDRRCLTWMREAEEQEHYFGSVQSRGGLSMCPEERGIQREALVVPEERPEEVQEEKKSCNPLRRLASRT